MKERIDKKVKNLMKDTWTFVKEMIWLSQRSVVKFLLEL